MIDVSHKQHTLRYARAEGRLHARPEVIQRITNRQIPKGDVLDTARSAGIQAAKRTADWIVFCHSLPIDWVEVRFQTAEDRVDVIAEVRAIWKTGVEMEAMTAASAALLNIYDMVKPVQDDIYIGRITLAEKTGGKSDYADTFDPPLRAALLLVGDRNRPQEKFDRLREQLTEHLAEQPVEPVICEQHTAEDESRIEERLRELCDEEQVDLVLTCGGTGLGSRDRIPEITACVREREVPGVAEALRDYGHQRTPYAMLSRQQCGLRGHTLLINLPGSTGGLKESLDALFPGLLHAFPMIWDGRRPESR